MNGLIGYSLVDNKSFSTLGVTTYVLGSTITAMPAALWMARVGRRRGFMTGSVLAIIGSSLAAWALWQSSFILFCIGTAIIGGYAAFGLQYRFAAAEVAAPAFRVKAISLVLTGGIAGGFLGPEAARWGQHLLPIPFLGSFLILAGIAILALFIQAQVRIPAPAAATTTGQGRPLREIIQQPVFIVAALSGATGYALMNLLMTATPLAMDFCGHPFSSAAYVIEWHVVSMYAPGFFTGTLITRYGPQRIIFSGTLLVAGCIATALSGMTVTHFLVGLILLGIGWNFMYTGATTLLTESCRAEEKARTQGANDFAVFAGMSLSSVASGALVSNTGWETMNIAAIPILLVVVIALFWLKRMAYTTKP